MYTGTCTYLIQYKPLSMSEYTLYTIPPRHSAPSSALIDEIRKEISNVSNEYVYCMEYEYMYQVFHTT